MSETIDAIAAARRELRDHESGLKTLSIRRTYDASQEDVWDALTDPERGRPCCSRAVAAACGSVILDSATTPALTLHRRA